MDFEITHSFPAPPGDVAAVLLDRRFQDSLAEVSTALSAREVLSQEERGDGTVIRRVRCVLGVDLGAAKTFIGDSEPAWVEEARWNPGAMAWTWEIEPEVGGQLLTASGTVELDGGPEETARTVLGDVRVKVPLYGGRVEGLIVEHLEGAYDEEAHRIEQWLRSRAGT
ncbi:MAG: DUF2505 domain-containing protein [Actinomycetota bacterium]